MEFGMLRTITLALILLGATIELQPARADFILKSEAHGMGQVSLPDEDSNTTIQSTPLRPSNLNPATARVQIACGFGRQIPLSFAVRQIVPHAVRVIYAGDIDASTLVTWTGGEAWSVVLAHAVSPLGLHIQVSQKIVTIYR
jgi:hypothetical protein